MWWCCTGPEEDPEALEVVARDITGGTQTAFDGEEPAGVAGSRQLWAQGGGFGRKKGWRGWSSGEMSYLAALQE